MELINFNAEGKNYTINEISTCDNQLNLFVPFINLFSNGELIEINNKFLYVYKNYVDSSHYLYHKKSVYDYVFRLLNNYINNNYYFSIKDSNYIFNKGIIRSYPSNKILLCLCITNKYVFNIKIDNIDYSKFVLFINNEFKQDIHKTLFSKINKEYIIPLIEKNISIMWTNNIEDWCYKEIKSIPKFNSITEMNNYLLTFNEIAYGK